jgi:low affinity Fe/Cu permease
MADRAKPRAGLFERLASAATSATGKPLAFIIACLVILVWGATGPLFGFSDTWQLVINTSTTIITFLMVFVIQHAQNKETAAIQLKLNELIASQAKASNRLVDVEDLTDAEITTLKKFYVELARLAQSETDIHASHSIDEAAGAHREKIAKSTRGKKPAAEG